MAQISVINIAELQSARRLDAEYYQPAYLAAEKVLSRCSALLLGELASDIRYGIYTEPDYLSEGISFIRALNLKDLAIEGEILKVKPAAIPNSKYLLKQGDILIVRSGANVGDVGIILDKLINATFGSYTIRLRLKPAENPYLAYVFLKTKYGRLQTMRFRTGLAQPNINIPNLGLIRIVSHSETVLAENVESLVRQSHKEVGQSKKLYAQVQQAVLDEADFREPEMSKQTFYETTAREAKLTDRLDAEYYRPIYRAADTKVRSIGSQAVELGELCETLTNGHTPLRHPLDEGDVVFLTAEHVHDFRLDLNSDKRILAAHHQGELKRTALKPGDILVTIKGKTGNAVVVGNLPGPSNINQDVALIRLKPGVSPDYFCAFLNSPLGKLLSARMATNQINPFLGLGNLSKIPVPLLEERKMDKIGAKVREILAKAKGAEGKAKSLIEEAKQLAEDFIAGAG